MPCGDGKNCSQHPAQNSISRHKVEERNKTNAFNLDRNAFFLQFFSRISSVAAITTFFPQLSEAIEFVPASPSYNGTYQDAMEILSSQRLAVDNISDVISNGNLDEAGFKAMQLSAQIRTAGKIILDSIQERSSYRDANNSFNVLRFLACQKKFVTLLDLCDEFSVTLVNGMAGKLGVVSVAQIKLTPILDEVKNAYDDFLLDVGRDEWNIDPQYLKPVFLGSIPAAVIFNIDFGHYRGLKVKNIVMREKNMPICRIMLVRYK